MKSNHIKTLCIVLCMGLISCNTGITEEKTAEADSQEVVTSNKIEKLPFTVTAAELCADFSINRDNAVHKYGDNVINLSGTVKTKRRATQDNCSYITMECDTQDNDTSGIIIKCCMKENSSIFENAREGEEVTIQAKVRIFDQNIIDLDEVSD